MPYFIAFNDVHNFPVPLDVYKKFLREEWLSQTPSIEKVNLNGVKSKRVIEQKVIVDGKTNTWNGKYYPKTRDENIKILDDYLTLCTENNVRPITFLAPMTERFMANFNKEMLTEFYQLVEQALKKYPDTIFIDGWKWDGVTYADFYDYQHMNVHGAAKFSAYLNEFIENLEKQGR